MVRCGSVSRNLTANAIRTGCGINRPIQSQERVKLGGHPSQKVIDAQKQMKSHRLARRVKKHVIGLHTICRVIHPPPATILAFDCMRKWFKHETKSPILREETNDDQRLELTQLALAWRWFS